MTDQQKREGLHSIAVTHPFWVALDAILTEVQSNESLAAAACSTNEDALRQCGRLSMIHDLAGVLRNEMKEQPKAVEG